MTENQRTKITRKLAIFYGMWILLVGLLKYTFDKSILIYRCPTCSLVIRPTDDECLRCGQWLERQYTIDFT